MSYSSEYRKTPKGRFVRQKDHAKNRGIEWKLTFEEWYKIWLDSGYWSERGRGKGKYCMSRYWDEGAYEVGNVHIIKHEDNIKLQHMFSSTCREGLNQGKLSENDKATIKYMKELGIPADWLSKMFDIHVTAVYHTLKT